MRVTVTGELPVFEITKLRVADDPTCTFPNVRLPASAIMRVCGTVPVPEIGRVLVPEVASEVIDTFPL